MSRLQQRTAYAHSSTPSPAPILLPNPTSGRNSPYNIYPNGNGNAIAGPSSRPSSTLNPSQRERERDTYSESPYGGGGRSEYSKTTHQLEGQNEDKLAGIMGKVKLLKDLSLGIGDEVRASNMELGGMNDTFSSTSGFLGGTLKRMNAMARKQGGNWWRLIMFLVLVLWIFIIVWFLRR